MRWTCYFICLFVMRWTVESNSNLFISMKTKRRMKKKTNLRIAFDREFNCCTRLCVVCFLFSLLWILNTLLRLMVMMMTNYIIDARWMNTLNNVLLMDLHCCLMINHLSQFLMIYPWNSFQALTFTFLIYEKLSSDYFTVTHSFGFIWRVYQIRKLA